MRADPVRVAGIVLAAGASTRAGAANKLLLPLDGHPLVWWPVRAAVQAGLDPVVLVTASGGDAVRAATETAGEVVHVENSEPGRGLASSLVLGLEVVAHAVDAAVILLGDMPRVGALHIERLVAAFDPAARRAVCIPTCSERRGNPVLWGARFFDEIRALQGDQGARAIAALHASWVHEVPMADEAVLQDVDTLADWRAAGEALPKGG